MTPARTASRPRVPAFTNAASAEAWDAWFRWRDGDDLRDLTIESTWERVARALAERGGAPERFAAYLRAFSEWRLLPDASVLRHAGTAGNDWPLDSPTATLNLAAFVQHPLTPHAALDEAQLGETSRLARCLVDDAASDAARRRGTVALVGIGDALAMLGLRYDSDEARARAARIARIVAEAARPAGDSRGGVAVELGRQPRLALLANATSEGADPVKDEYVLRWADRGDRITRVLGPALTLRRERRHADGPVPRIDTAREIGADARALLVRALAPWIDVGDGPPPEDSSASRGAARGRSVA